MKPVPRDLLFFLKNEVFPHAPLERLEELLHCSRVLLVEKGKELREPGLYIVYNGLVELGGSGYGRSDYFILPRGSAARATGESIVIHAPLGCGEDVAKLAGEPCRVRDLVHRSLVSAPPSMSVGEAVALMAREGVSSIIVVSREGRPLGIFTDTDLRRLVAGGCSLDTPLGEAATSNPVGVPPHTPCMEAARVMMEHNIKHLLIVAPGGKAEGVVTVRDIAYAEALGPLYARRLIDRASSPRELAEAYRRLLRILRRHAASLHPLAGRGSEAHELVAMASLVLRSVAARAAWLAARKLGAPSKGWVYLVMGSNARLEQFTATDRDTALIYTRDMAREEARRLAEEIEDTLDSIGFPGCSHGYTARSLLLSLDEARETLRRAAANPSGEKEIVLIGLFADATAVHPPEGSKIAAALRRSLAEAVHEAGSAPYIRQALAAYRPKLGPLGRLPRSLDLKKQGLAPMAFAAKALALAEAAWEPVATRDRLEALAARGALPADTAAEALEAHRVLLAMAAWASATQGTRVIDAGSLSGVERSLLREALRAAQHLVDRARAPA